MATTLTRMLLWLHCGPIYKVGNGCDMGSVTCVQMETCINTLRPRQNGRHFADDTFKRIFVNENVRISVKFSLKFVHKGPINNIPVLVQIMAWRRPGDKPLSEPVMVSLLTHICVTRPQWVNGWDHWNATVQLHVSANLNGFRQRRRYLSFLIGWAVQMNKNWVKFSLLVETLQVSRKKYWNCCTSMASIS